MKKISTLSIATLMMGVGGIMPSYALSSEPVSAEGIDFRAIPLGEKVEALTTYRADAPAHVITVPSDDDPYISKAPAGEHRMLVHYGEAYGFSSYIGQWQQSSNGTIANLILGEDNKVYLNNIITQTYADCYVEGTRDGDRLTFSFPQVIYHNDDEDYNYYALVMVEKPINEYEETWYFPAEDQTYTFIMQEDGTLVPENPNLMIGQCGWEEADEYYPAQWVWRGNGDLIKKLAPNLDTPVEVPAEAKFELWNFISGAEARAIEGAIVGNNIYLRGTCEAKGLENAAIMGTIEGDEVIFKTGQYMGVYVERNILCYFISGAMVPNPYNEEYKTFEPREQMAFKYDAAAKKLDGTGVGFIFSTNKETKVYFQTEVDPIFCVPDYTKPQAAPYPPIGVRFWDDVPSIPNAYEIDFDFPFYDENFIILDIRNLSYQLLIDDKPYTFQAPEYRLLTAPMTDIPFDMSQDEFFSKAYQHALILYKSVPLTNNVAIRTVFKQGAKLLYSDPVKVDVPKSIWGKVETIEMDKVVSIDSYDLSGRKVVDPLPGIYMQKYMMSDGSVVVRKEVIK